MTGFIDSLVDRFNGVENAVAPRLTGKFEPVYPDQQNLPGGSATIDDKNIITIAGTNETLSSQEIQTRHADNITDKEPHFHTKEERSFSASEKRKATIINSGDNEMEPSPLGNIQPSHTFIQPSLKDKSPISLHTGMNVSSEFKKGSHQNAVNDVVFPSVIHHEVEKEKQRNKEGDLPDLSLMPGQFSRETDNGQMHRQTDLQNNTMPVIKISIGKIEVRATQAAGNVKIKNEPVQKPRLSLEEYLQKRNGGK